MRLPSLRSHRIAILGAAWYFLSGCSSDNFTDYNVLGDLRILTITVDQPEANPGTTVNLTPVLSDLNGAGRTLNYSIVACIDPGVSLGVAASCANPDASNTQSGTVTIPAGTSQTYTGAVPSFPITLPSTSAIFGSASPVQQFNGIAYLVFYNLSAPGGVSINSFVRVIVSASSKTQKNNNPTITSVNFNDAPVSSPVVTPTAVANLSVINPPASAETYQTMSPTGTLSTQTETLVSTWFISDGSTQFQRTTGNGENPWTPPGAVPSTRGLVIVVVTRDERNGAVFQKIELN
jgi:hypothetical protein